MAVNPENYFTGDGSTTSFVFTFEYIDETDVKVSVDGTVQATTAYSFANATTILFDTAPAADTEVRIYRDTNVDELKSTFFAGSSIRAQDLNQNFEQNNFAVQEIKAYTWDNETQTIHSDETWVSSDAQIATTAAMDQRFQDEAQDTLTKAELAALSDVIPDNDDAVPTTGAVKDYVDHVIETDILVDGTGLNKTGSSGQVTIGISAGSVDLDRIKPADIVDSTETWSATDTQVATTQAIEDRIDEIITNDIGTDGTGITVTDDGDGTITLGLANNSIDLARIKNADIITSGESDPDNDTTIATTAKIGDMIDVAIANDITSDGSGVTVTDDGDGTITLSVEEGALNLNRINAGNIVTESEQDAGITEADTTIFTTLAAAKRFDTLVQTASPSGSAWEVGKTWLQNDDDLTLSIWNGTGWTAVSSGGTFTEQPSVVYVDQASGDDNNTGHRISTPKATIKAAIEQINAEIDTEITAGGSGYGEGSYTTVSLTGGTGSGLTANITVNASGAVSAVTINDTDVLEDYSIGDVLSAADADLGNTGLGTGFQLTVTGDGDGQIVVVSAGTYQEVAPIQIKRRNVSVIGQAMRSCIVHPTSATELNNLFELNSGSYIANLTLTGMQAGTGTGNTLDAVLPTDQGWNFAFYNNAFITKSPYIQNCTNFSDSEIDNDDLRSHRPRGGTAGDTDSAPTGGGLLVNGATPHADSPLRSMVADSYTHVALNGPGILVTNNGYTQITSSYAFFNTYHIKCLNGGQANLAASTTDFGDRSLVADGRSTTNIFTANCVTQANVNDTTIRVSNGVADASWHGTSTRPASNMLLSVNSDAQIYPITNVVPQDQATFDADPAGYTGDWIVTISRPDPNNRSNNLGFSAQVATGTNNVQFWLRSMIASSGHTMEYVGSGTNYTALPENGGVPDETRQITESNNGKVWTAITDHNGKFRIGGNQTDDPVFEVDQQLGFVTSPEGSIAFNLLSDQTPQLGGNLDVQARTITTSTTDGNITLDPNGTGVVDVSTSRITNVTDPTGNQDAATKAYVDAEVGAIGTPSSISTLNTSVATSDTGTNGTITFTTDGTTAMTVDNNQRLGVGTTSPGKKLVVNHGAGDGLMLIAPNTAESTLYFGDTDDDDVGRIIYDHSINAMKFRTNTTEALRIDSNGRLLIGTSSSFESASGALLQIKPSASNTTPIISLMRNDSTITNNNNLGQLAFYSDDGTPVKTAHISGVASQDHTSTARGTDLTFSTTATDTADAPTERMRIKSNGRVGIGETSPDRRLHVRNDGSYALKVGGESGDAYYLELGQVSASSSPGINYTGTSASLRFLNNGTEVARFNNSGNLGIGTTSPSNKLVVSNGGAAGLEVFFADSGASVALMGFNRSTSARTPLYLTGEDIRFQAGGSDRVRIDSSGRLLVGTSSALTTSNDAKIQGVSATGAELYLGRDDSTVTDGTVIGRVLAFGNAGGTYEECGRIQIVADGTHALGDKPSRLVFSTTADGASSPTERLRIAQSGAFGLSGANFGTSGQVLTSQGSSAAPQWATPAGGKILNVSYQLYDTTTSLSVSPTWNDVPGISVTVTPASTNSKFIISGVVNGEWANVGYNWGSAVTVGYTIGGTTTWIQPGGAGNRIDGLQIPKLSYYAGDANSTPEGFTIANYVHAPATTSSITYRFGMQCQASGTTFYVNRTVGDLNTEDYNRFRSWITVMEVSD